MKAWALVISSCLTLPSSVSFHSFSDVSGAQGRGDMVWVINGSERSHVSWVPHPLEKRRLNYLASCTWENRPHPPSRVDCLWLLKFHVLQFQPRDNTSSPLPPIKLGQWFSNFSISITWNACWNAFLGLAHRTSDSVLPDETQNFAFLSSYQVVWMLLIRDHALQTCMWRSCASLWSQVNHSYSLTSNPSYILRNLSQWLLLSG